MIALFDFDGVIVDTESQYTVFWDRMGAEYLGIEDFGRRIKGQTLVQIFDGHFSGMLKEQEEVVARLNEYEAAMSYDFLPGVVDFLHELKEAGVPTAIVTSSNQPKMEQVYRAHPQLDDMVDAILTSEDFSRSKPDPECFLKGMEILGGTPEETVVFEDSFHGLAAGRAAGAYVVGLATTNSREDIVPLCDMVISDFTNISLSSLKQVKSKKA
ncbi:MAG: HAD family phosphatase [Bacteroidales bacterium]|nr:HAD family phosphatase [Bacteroidales bacterium]